MPQPPLWHFLFLSLQPYARACGILSPPAAAPAIPALTLRIGLCGPSTLPGTGPLRSPFSPPSDRSDSPHPSSAMALRHGTGTSAPSPAPCRERRSAPDREKGSSRLPPKRRISPRTRGYRCRSNYFSLKKPAVTSSLWLQHAPKSLAATVGPGAKNAGPLLAPAALDTAAIGRRDHARQPSSFSPYRDHTGPACRNFSP